MSIIIVFKSTSSCCNSMYKNGRIIISVTSRRCNGVIYLEAHYIIRVMDYARGGGRIGSYERNCCKTGRDGDNAYEYNLSAHPFSRRQRRRQPRRPTFTQHPYALPPRCHHRHRRNNQGNCGRRLRQFEY